MRKQAKIDQVAATRARKGKRRPSHSPALADPEATCTNPRMISHIKALPYLASQTWPPARRAANVANAGMHVARAWAGEGVPEKNKKEKGIGIWRGRLEWIKLAVALLRLGILPSKISHSSAWPRPGNVQRPSSVLIVTQLIWLVVPSAPRRPRRATRPLSPCRTGSKAREGSARPSSCLSAPKERTWCPSCGG